MAQYPDYMKRVFPEGDDRSPKTMIAEPSPEQVDKPNPVENS
jgi:hypothetical protein